MSAMRVAQTSRAPAVQAGMRTCWSTEERATSRWVSKRSLGIDVGLRQAEKAWDGIPARKTARVRVWRSQDGGAVRSGGGRDRLKWRVHVGFTAGRGRPWADFIIGDCGS